MDAGCGNGKYLNVRKDLIMEGCDRSIGLLNLSSQMNGNDHMLCDILNLPYKYLITGLVYWFRPNTFDGIISIAVIHHLSSSGHRLRAIQNLVQLLTIRIYNKKDKEWKIDGRALIYVWALEQEEGMRRKFEKQVWYFFFFIIYRMWWLIGICRISL